ncbi:vesicle coat protein [Schizothecium vesticola]|uniref:Vesicle coat protein n=1 Tax=Schizothecium vesticola TaxID=314040 RepID=A0AA40F2F4_9PEZI|nr:vesicle coat protein [Schizothecium vesticola]
MLTLPPFQLCLAHYCELHGPTPLMVTEGLPVPCGACSDDDLRSYPAPADRPQTSAQHTRDPSHTAAITEALRRADLAGARRSASASVSEQEAQTYRASLRRSAQAAGHGSAVETPPLSPRPSQSAQQPRHEFRRTYDEYVTRRAGPCENCALTLPKRQESGKESGPNSRPDRGPTLRTRAPCARVFPGMDNNSPPSSQASSSRTSEDESGPGSHPVHRRTATTASLTSRASTRSGADSASSAGSGAGATHAHTHYLDYTSTHEPLTPASFSFVRASCLRTLSLETLPRAPATTTPPLASSTISTPSASPIVPGFVTTHSAGSAASGGPIFFGDPATGFTTAYIFRIPDIHARGHKRVYAFLALSTHRERLAMKTFGFMAAAFRDLAAWIQALAEAEAERELAAAAASPIGGAGGYGSFPAQQQQQQDVPPASAAAASSGGSSFLMAGSGGLLRRVGGGGGFGGGGVALKPRGLAELVGRPDFFIELHTRFVRLLLELGVALGS